MDSTQLDNRVSMLTKEEFHEIEDQAKTFMTSRDHKITYHEFGDPEGDPIFFYHGTGAHIHSLILHKPAQEFGFRIITPDRPGVGDSDFWHWELTDFATDVNELADHLGLDKFGIMGISGGGPTLYATAYKIPGRLNFCVDLACAKPVFTDPEMIKDQGFADKFYAKVGAKLPLALFEIPYGVLGVMQKVIKSPKSFAKMFNDSLSETDKLIFDDPGFQYIFMHDFQYLFKHGAKGPAYDAQTNYRAWDFDITKVEFPVQVYQGAADLFIPAKHSDWLIGKIPNVNIKKYEGQGHFYHVYYGYQLLGTVRRDLCK